jgi:hypothetical protein
MTIGHHCLKILSKGIGPGYNYKYRQNAGSLDIGLCSWQEQHASRSHHTQLHSWRGCVLTALAPRGSGCRAQRVRGRS